MLVLLRYLDNWLEDWGEKGGINAAILLRVIKSNIFFFSSSATPRVQVSVKADFGISLLTIVTWCLPLIVELFWPVSSILLRACYALIKQWVHARKAAVVFGGWKRSQGSVASKFMGETLALRLFASTSIFSSDSLEAIMIHFMRKWHVSTLFPKEQSLN